MNLDEIKDLIILTLATQADQARNSAFKWLQAQRKSESEFLAAIIQYSEELGLNSEQWFDLLSKLRFRILRDDLRIMSKLSENQREKLPPPLFER